MRSIATRSQLRAYAQSFSAVEVRDAQRGGRLLGGEAGEEPELDQLGLARVLRFELPEGLVQGEQAVAVPLLQGRLDVVEVEPAASAPGLAGLLVPGPVDQDAPHGLGGRGEEVPAAVPVPGLLPAHQPEVGLVDQGGGLERLARLLLGQLLGRQLAQLVVDERQELLGGVRVALLDRVQHPGDRVHRPGPTSPAERPCRRSASAERTGDE